MTDYTADFSAAWALYASPKNSSKSLAFRNWLRLGKERPSQELILAEIFCYNRWLAEQSAKNGREYPKCHMATWLAQRRYEGFEDDAQAMIASRKALQGHSHADAIAASRGWEEPQDSGWTAKSTLKMAFTRHDPDKSFGAIYENWLRPAVFINGQPIEIRSPSQYHASELEKRFGPVIRQAFGDDVQLTVAKKTGPEG